MWAGKVGLQKIRFPEIRRALEKANVRPITAERTRLGLERERLYLLDVRPEDEYRGGRACGSYNVPLFRRILGWNASKVARRAAFLAFGVVNGTEENPEFLNSVLDAFDASNVMDKEIVVVCGSGSWPWRDDVPTETYDSRKITRSLQAAYTLVEAGITNVRVLDGGVRAWYEAGLDMECDDAWSKEWDIEG